VLSRWALFLAAVCLVCLGLAPALPATVERVLPSGMRVVAQAAVDGDAFAVDLAVRSDGSEEGDLPGLRGVVARTLLAGAEGRDPEAAGAFTSLLEDEGGATGGRANDELVEVNGYGPARHLVPFLELLRDALVHPTFPEETLQNDLKATRVFLQMSSPDQEMERELRSVLFPVPAAAGSLGTDESLARITRDDVVAFAKRLFAPERLVLALVGPLPAEELAAKVADLFGGLEASGAGAPQLPDWHEQIRREETREWPPLLDWKELGVPAGEAGPPALPSRGIVHEVDGAPVSRLMVGFEIPPVSSPDWPLGDMVAALLDPVSGGRLSQEAALAQRSDNPFPATGAACSAARAIAYNHLVILAFGRAPGGPRFRALDWVRALAVQGLAVHEDVMHAIESLRVSPPDAAELERAKRRALGDSRIRLQTARDRAQFLALTSLAGLGTDGQQRFEERVRTTTPEDIQSFVATYLASDEARVVYYLPRSDRPDGYTNFPML